MPSTAAGAGVDLLAAGSLIVGASIRLVQRYSNRHGRRRFFSRPRKGA